MQKNHEENQRNNESLSTNMDKIKQDLFWKKDIQSVEDRIKAIYSK